MKNKHPILAAAITLAILSPGISSGALTATFTSQAINGNPHVGTIAATTGDLLETQGSVAAAADFTYPSGLPNTNLSTRVTSLRDGTINTVTNVADALFRGGSGDFVTFNLNTTINVNGYDITSLKTIASWTDARAGQSWTVEYSVVGSPTFTNFYTIGDQAAGSVVATRVSQVLLNEGGSVLSFGANSLTGVDAIRFNFDDVGTSTWQAYREIDVIGVATIPEPASALLGGIGMIALLRRRRA